MVSKSPNEAEEAGEGSGEAASSIGGKLRKEVRLRSGGEG